MTKSCGAIHWRLLAEKIGEKGHEYAKQISTTQAKSAYDGRRRQGRKVPTPRWWNKQTNTD